MPSVRRKSQQDRATWWEIRCLPAVAPAPRGAFPGPAWRPGAGESGGHRAGAPGTGTRFSPPPAKPGPGTRTPLPPQLPAGERRPPGASPFPCSSNYCPACVRARRQRAVLPAAPGSMRTDKRSGPLYRSVSADTGCWVGMRRVGAFPDSSTATLGVSNAPPLGAPRTTLLPPHGHPAPFKAGLACADATAHRSGGWLEEQSQRSGRTAGDARRRPRAGSAEAGRPRDVPSTPGCLFPLVLFSLLRNGR